MVVLLAGRVASAAPEARVPVDRVSAIVEDSVIWQSDVDDHAVPNVPVSQVLDGLIDETLYLRRARELQIRVDAAEVDAAIHEIEQQNGLDPAAFDAALAAQGYTRARYRVEVEHQLIRLRTQSVDIQAKVQITDREVDAEVARRKLKPDAKETVRRELRQKEIDRRTADWLVAQRKHARIERYAATGSTAAWKNLRGAIAKLEVASKDARLGKTVEPVFAGEVGQPLDRARLRTKLAAAMAIRGVSEVSARAVQTGKAVKLVVDVMPQPIIRTLTAREASGTAIALTGAGPTVAIGGALDPTALDTITHALADRFYARGFLDASARWTAVPVSPGVVDVVVEVTPGQASTIAAIELVGNRAVAAKDLGAIVDPLIKPGDPYRDDVVEQVALRIQQLYYERGYINVKVVTSPAAAGPQRLVVTIEEGPQFRLGALSIKGPKPDDAARYRKLITVKTGAVFKRSEIADIVDKLSRAVEADGGKDVSVSPITKIDLPKRTIDIAFEIARSP